MFRDQEIKSNQEFSRLAGKSATAILESDLAYS